MNKLKYILLIITLIFPLISKSQDYCSFIQKVQEYQNLVRLKSVAGTDIIDTSSFNLKTYLSFFDKIEIENRYKIGVYFIDEHFGGNPYLYAIRKNKDFDKNKDKEKLFELLSDSNLRAKNHIKPQNTEIGFFQYLFFSEMGEQFVLKWHSKYNEKYIICSQEEWDEIILELRNDNNEGVESVYYIDSIGISKLEKIDPEIVVESKDDFYIIRWIENRTHRGIYWCKFQVKKKAPYAIEKVDEEKIVDILIDVVY